MVAIVAGNGLGLLNTSLNTVGATSLLGGSVLSQGGSRVTVNVVNGNLVLQAQDARLAGRGADLVALRTHNSLGTPTDGDGDGWRWGYEQTVQFQGPGTPMQPGAGATVLRTDGDGHETVYAWNTQRAAYLATEGSGAHDELHYDATASEWSWIDGSSRVIERYSDSIASGMTGRLVRRTDSSGNSITLSYDGGRLTLIQDAASQQELRLIYAQVNGLTRAERLEARSLAEDATGRATASLDDPLRLVKYDYDGQGRLITVTRHLAPNGGTGGGSFVTTYDYGGSDSRIAGVAESDGTGLSFSYDADGRLSAVKDRNGGSGDQLAFAYDTLAARATVTDGTGQVWTWRHDTATGRLTEVMTPPVANAGLSTTFQYDPEGNLVRTVDPNGHAATYGYDGSGNRALERDAVGGTTTRTFSPLNQVLTETRYRVTDPDGAGPQMAADPVTTRYVYDVNARLRFLVSAEGRVTENRYGSPTNGYGLLTETRLYIGQLFDVGGLGPTQQLTEAELDDWVAGLPDRTQVQLTEYSYDLRGNVSQQTSYATVSAAGGGVLDGQATVAEYVHDAHGRLRQRMAVRGSARDRRAVVAGFVYDGLGRVLRSEGANGSQTTVYDDANQRITTTATGGLTETRDFDDRGRLASVILSGDGMERSTRYVYDNADRLRMIEDAQGGRRYRFYDAAGRPEYQVDATGAVTRLEHSGTGQLVRQTQYVNRADTVTWYDSATGTVTKDTLTAGGPGSDVLADAARDRVTSSEYDAAGRIVASTDAAGTVTTIAYDGLSRVVMTQTGDRVTRYLYDKDHRRVGIVDALGFFTEYRYDAGGRLVETVRYSNRSPAAANVTAPVWLGVTDQTVAGGQPFDYRVPAYDADGDALTVSIVGPAPAWLSFDAATATLHGTPPVMSGVETVTLRADDGRGRTSDVSVRFTVVPAGLGIGNPGTGPAWDPLPPLDIIADAPVSHSVPAAADPSATYSLVHGLPHGLSFDENARTITGMSGAVGFYGVLLRATDGSGRSTDRTLSIRIRSETASPAQPAGSDDPSAWRPADTSGLRSYLYYDGQGRVVGAVDEQQFLTETVYDDALNTQQTRRYLIPVTVAPDDTLMSLKSRAGAARQLSLVRFDDLGRVHEVTALDGSTVTRNEYDEAGRLVRVVVAAETEEERAHRTFYNAFGEVVATVGGEGDAWLGANATPQRIEDAIRDYGTRHAYDTLGRRIRTVDANGNRTLFYYDRESRRTHTVDVIGHAEDQSLAGEVSETLYDSFGQVRSARRYATRLGSTDLDQLLAGSGGGGLADQALLARLATLADASIDQVVVYEYDRAGRLVKQVDGEGGFAENHYNVYGELAAQLRSTRAGQTATRQIDYDLLGRVVSQTLDAGGINANTRTDYDAFGRVVRSVDATGRATTTAYPESGRSVAVTDPLQRTTRTDYDALGRTLRVTDALGQQTVHAYDEAARSISATTPEGRQVTTTRTRHGETLSVTDARGNITRYGYNRNGQPTTVTDALGRLTAQTTYDKSGRRHEVTDARGTVTRFGYDQRNRVVERRIDPTRLNLTTLYAFDALGQLVALTEAAGTPAQRVTTYGYDRKGRTRTVVVDAAEDGLRLCTTSGYDGLDNVVSLAHGTPADPNRDVRLYEFDNLGRRVKEVTAPSAVFGAGPEGTRDLATHYRYDAAGRLTRLIDANGQSAWLVHDLAGQQTYAISALGEVSESRYDAAGRLVYSHRYLQPLAAGTVAAFGDAIRDFVAPAATPDDQRSHVVRDADGHQRFALRASGAAGWTVGENRLDAAGNIVEVRAYDRFLPDARLAALDSAASPGITVAEIESALAELGYDEDDPGTLAGVQRTYLVYDASNRQRFTVDPSGAVTEHVHNTAGALTATRRFAVRPALTGHDEAEVDAAVDRDDPDNRVTRHVHDAAGRLRYTVDALGSISGNDYDARGNVVTTVRWATRPVLAEYTEDAVAAAVALLPAANDQVTRLVYDAADRLRFTIDATGAVAESTYDVVGNVVATTRFAGRPALASFTEAAVTAAVEPLRGDLENQVNRFAYDAARRLRFAVDSLGTITESTYDGRGNLLSTIRFAAIPAVGQVDETTLAAAVAPLQADIRNRVTRFAYDALGRLRFTVDGLGSVSERFYDAVGNLTGTERFAVRPSLAQHTEEAISAAVAPLRGHPGNRIEHHVLDPLGRLRFNLLRLTLEAGQARYSISAQELNALGQTVGTTAYATAIALSAVSEATIVAAIGAGDPSRDRITRFVHDLAGRQIFRLSAVSVEADRRQYRVNAQRFDAFGQAVGSTDYAATLALDTIDETSVGTAVAAVADPSRDRVSAVAYDVLGQPAYSVLALAQDAYQVVRHEHDALGRVTRITQYATAIGPLAGVDRAAVEAAAGAAASASDRRTQYVYDTAGRQRFVLQADKAGHWTVGESRYDAMGNAVEVRRYDRYLTDAWIDSIDAMRPLGLLEEDVAEQLAALGYSDNAPASLADIQRTRFAYDAQNRLRFTVDALGSVAENVYDALGDLVTTVRFAGRPALTQYTAPAIDAAVDRADAANRVRHTVHDAAGRSRFDVRVIAPNVAPGGRHWVDERRYDALGQLVDSLAYATPVAHLTAYDEAVLATAVVADAARDRRSVTVYDAGGRQAFALRQLSGGQTDSYIVTRQVHDALGQLVQRIEYAAPVSPAQLDAVSVESAIAAQPWSDRTTTYVRDAGGRLRFEIRPDLSFRESLYDAVDQVIETRLFDFRLPDSAPRTEAQMAALRGSRAVGDGVTRGQVQSWDAAGRLLGSVDGLGNAEHYAYDALGERTHWTDKNGHAFACVYDRRGRKISETTPSMKFKLRGENPATLAPERVVETRFEYDAFGNLIRKVEAANFANDASTTDFAFDTVGRPIRTLYNGFYDPATGTVEAADAANRFRPEAAITYDALGNAVRFGTRSGVDAFEHTWRTYDSQGQVVHEVNALNNVTRYDHNAFGERETVTRYSVTISGTPQNGVYWTAAEIDPKLNWGYDEVGNLLEDARARTIRLAYDKLGRKITVTMPTAEYYSTHVPGDAAQANYFRQTPGSVVARPLDAAVTRYEYSAFGDVTRQRVRANTIVEWQDTSSTYDTMGRRTRIVDAAGNVTVMAYDAAGNLVRQEELTGQPDGSDRITQFAYNLLDQQVRVDRYGLRYTDANGDEHGVATWTWANGGEWLDPDADVATTVRTATYDPYGRPLAVTDPAGNLTSMRYDALGHLIQVTAAARPVAPMAANASAAVDPFRDQLSEMLVTSMTLDPLGRPVRQVRATSQGADARVTVQSYDAAGNLVSTTDAEGGIKRRACDHAGRIIRETQAIHANLGPLGVNTQGLERRYAYDALGQLTDTLDVYLDGANLVQSGKSVVYNPFGEVAEERRKWGPANQDIATLSTARVAAFHYDNAGHVTDKVAGDGLTVYAYNLLGQVTREEKRGNTGDSDGTGWRITEIQYDILGRAIMVRRPVFDADVTPGTGTTVRLVTPYSSRTLDRWGNVTGTQEGGYQVVNGQPVWAPSRIFRSYRFDDNNRVVTESLGTYGYTSSSGISTNAMIYKRHFRDLLGNVVKEVDEARDPQAETLISSRTRQRQYDSTGRVTAEIDGSGRKVEYAYNIHGERLGTRNARGTVFFDRRDRNGNIRFQGLLRTAGPAGAGEYDSLTGSGTIARTYLKAYLHDQAGRRFASKTFTGAANAPWSYTWLDGRNLGVQQRDEMGRIAQYRFDPFGNKAAKIDSGGARSEWNAATADYIVGRIDTYRLPADAGQTFGRYVYNDFGEVKVNPFGNTTTEYDRHKNGLVARVTIRPDVTQTTLQEMTTYQYDVHGQVTMEGRFDSNPASIQTKLISYDTQRRLARVEDQNKVPAGPLSDVRYSYDEWGNVRRIQASYTQTNAEGPRTRDSWYDYDEAGRMTVSNGAMSAGEIRPKPRTAGSVQIHYDTVGRRERTTEFQGSYAAGPLSARRTWDTMRDELYEYNDLGHLRRIDQRIRLVNIKKTDLNGTEDPVSEPSKIGAWRPLSVRTLNLRGDVTRAEQWTRIAGTPNALQVNQVPTHLGVTTTSYRPDGQVTRTKFDADDPKKSTDTRNTYSAATGLLDSYVFKAFRSDGAEFNATFEYRYGFQQGERVVQRIRGLNTSLDTFKTYDLLGRLSSERIDLPKPNGPGSDRFEKRRYEHSADGRVIFKDSALQLSSSGPGTIPLDEPTTGHQTYVYAGSRMAATVGAERLAGATRFEFAYTPMSEASGSGASRYVVQSGESLIDIAQAAYGDGALWYVVADANGVVAEPADPLPSTEVGKAYELPDVVRSTHSATTSDSYGLAEIVGNDRPIAIPPPPPPRHSDIEVMARAAVAITVQVGATVGLSALGVPMPVSAAVGAGLSNLAGQATSWGLGMQVPGQGGIDWGSVGMATMQGYLFSVAGPAAAVSREVWQQATGGFEGWTSGPGLNWGGIGGSVFNVGFDALGPVLGGPRVGTFSFGMGALINSAYNPSSGWAIPGSGRSPTVGAFEYAYGAVANGLANIGYNWIRDQLERPSPSPKPPGPRSVDDARGPLPAELIDLWDEIDRQYTESLDAADRLGRNQQITAESDERLAWQLKLSAMQHSIEHFGEGIDDRAIIDALKRQKNLERVQREQAEALARARAAAKTAKLRANTARIEALIAKGPDPALLQYARDMDELNNQIVRDMYAEGTFVRVSANVNIDGLAFERVSGIYDTMGMYSNRNTLIDEEIRRYREFQKADPSLMGLEIIAIEDVNTPAAQARRLGLATVLTFGEFSRNYARKHGGSTEGVQTAFLAYHDQRSKEITAAWDRIDNAAGAVNLIARGTFAGVQFIFDPVGTVVPLVLETGTEHVLKAAGVDEQTAAMIGNLTGIVSGGAIGYGQIAKAARQSSVREILSAERAARAEYDSARLAVQAAEFEASKGIRVAEDITLFKGVPAQARVARPASYISGEIGASPASLNASAPRLLDAPASPPVLALADNIAAPKLVPTGGGLYHAGGDLHSVLPYEMTHTRGVADAAFNGFTPPTPRVIAYASDGSGGFAGGASGAANLKLPAIWHQSSDGTRLVTAMPGQPYYQSLGKSRSFVAGSDLPVYKNAGEFYPFLGIQETNTMIHQWNRSIHRGWYIKGLEYEQGRVISRMPPTNPALRNASFEIDPRIRTRPEEVNEWLAEQGAIPWIDARHFFGEGFDLIK